jgi:Holliday junction resolvase-like predicted endonuclease
MTGDKSTTRRRERELADFGEIRACQLLRQKGFTVERMPPNFPFFDLMATRGSCRLLVPVKTRNNTRATGKPKTDSYKLYDKPGHYDAAQKIAHFARAKIFWVAVTVDAKTKMFSAYTGDVAELRSWKSIPMHPNRDVPNYSFLTKDRHDDGISKTWTNVVGTVSV